MSSASVKAARHKVGSIYSCHLSRHRFTLHATMITNSQERSISHILASPIERLSYQIPGTSVCAIFLDPICQQSVFFRCPIHLTNIMSSLFFTILHITAYLRFSQTRLLRGRRGVGRRYLMLRMAGSGGGGMLRRRLLMFISRRIDKDLSPNTYHI